MKVFKTTKEFGNDLKEFLYSDEIFNLLPDCGWCDGGCRSLMKAMYLWLGDVVQPYQIVENKRDKHSQHAFVKVGEYFIDGDGVSSKSTLYNRWKNMEGLSSVIIRPFNPRQEPNDSFGNEQPFYIDEMKIQYLAKRLAERYDKLALVRLLIKQ